MSVRDKKGDTIIEVILAMTLLTLILFTSWGLVNRSTQAGLAARQRIEMVNELKEQAEILKSKYANEDGKADDLSEAIIKKTSITPQPGNALNYEENFCIDDPSTLVGDGRFFIDEAADFQPETKPVNNEASRRIWMEYTSGPGYYDYYVRGCWLTTGGQQKTDNSQFIVRLNK